MTNTPPTPRPKPVTEARGIVCYECQKCCCTNAKLIDSKDRKCQFCGHVQKSMDTPSYGYTGLP